jgi:hypothetical protein
LRASTSGYSHPQRDGGQYRKWFDNKPEADQARRAKLEHFGLVKGLEDAEVEDADETLDPRDDGRVGELLSLTVPLTTKGILEFARRFA